MLEAQTRLAQANSEYQKSLSGFWTAKAEFRKGHGGREMSMTDYKFPVTALPWLLLAILFIGCGPAEKHEPPPIPVGVSPAEAYQGNGEVRYSANIQPYARVELAFKSGGYLTNILQVKGVDGKMRNVHEGDYVKRGAVLAQVRQSDYEAKLAQAAGQNCRGPGCPGEGQPGPRPGAKPVCRQ